MIIDYRINAGQALYYKISGKYQYLAKSTKKIAFQK